MVRTDTAGFWKYMSFYGHSKKVLPPIVPIPDDPTTPEDPCDSCPSWYNCENWKCIPQWGWGWGWLTPPPVIDPIVPWEDEETITVPTEEEAIEAVECKAEVLHNNWFIELQNWYLTWADENSWWRFYFNTDCYEEVTFYWRLNAYYSTPRSILSFWWAWSSSTQTGIEIWLFHYVENEWDRFKVTFKANWDFRIEVQRIIDSETMYDWQTVESSSVNNAWWWNPTWTSIVWTPANKLIIHLEWAAYMTNVISTGVTVSPYDALEKKWIYTKAYAQWEVPISSWKVTSTPTMLWLNDWYNKNWVKYSNWLLTVWYNNWRSASYDYEFDTSAENCDNYSILNDFIFRVEKAWSVEDSIDVYISLRWWMEYWTSTDLTINGNTISSYGLSNVSDGNVLNITFDDITNVEFRFEQEIPTHWEWSLKSSCCYWNVNLLGLYYRNIWSSDWIKIWKWTASYGWKDYTISLNAEYSKIIVSYVWIFEKPSDDNIVVLYNWRATDLIWINNNLLVIRDKSNQEIEVSNQTTWESIIIMDRNLWAEEPFICLSTSDTSSERTWKFYQYWNNYWFPSDWITTTITTDTIDLSEYWPWNYYSSDVYRTASRWDSSNNTNIWWYITNTEEARRWPCPEWWHIPSASEFERLVTLLKNAAWGYTHMTEDRFMHILLFGFNWYADWRQSTVEYDKRGKLMYLHTSDYISGDKTTVMKWIVYDTTKWYIPYFDYISRNDSCCIRPFKNTTS